MKYPYATLTLVVLIVLALVSWLVVSFAVPMARAVASSSSSGVAWAEHEFYPCDSPRQLLFGHAVPPGERWVLTSIHAKNNSGPTPEINVAVYADDVGEWICLASKADRARYDGVAWSGQLDMGARWQLGVWFRGAEEGDVLQFDATYTRYGVVMTSSGKARRLSIKEPPPVPYDAP